MIRVLNLLFLSANEQERTIAAFVENNPGGKLVAVDGQMAYFNVPPQVPIRPGVFERNTLPLIVTLLKERPRSIREIAHAIGWKGSNVALGSRLRYVANRANMVAGVGRHAQWRLRDAD